MTEKKQQNKIIYEEDENEKDHHHTQDVTVSKEQSSSFFLDDTDTDEFKNENIVVPVMKINCGKSEENIKIIDEILLLRKSSC